MRANELYTVGSTLPKRLNKFDLCVFLCGILQVALIYKDASIGNPMNIAVVKLFVLKDIQLATRHHQQSGISAPDMLRAFCAWQSKHNDPNDASPHHHDSALLLTR